MVHNNSLCNSDGRVIRKIIKKDCTMEDKSKSGPEYVKIVVLDSAVESQLVCSILDDRNIPYFTKSYHDTAYDGLFQVQKGWGEICAPAEYKKEILEIVDDLRQTNNDP